MNAQCSSTLQARMECVTVVFVKRLIFMVLVVFLGKGEEITYRNACLYCYKRSFPKEAFYPTLRISICYNGEQ
jgi:hypothetical protein